MLKKGFQTVIQNLEAIKQNTGKSYCTSQTVFFLFVCLFFVLQTEGLWQLHMELFYQCHLCNSICSLHVSVSHFGILPYFKFFITCYGDLRSVAFDVIVIAFRHRELCPYRLMNPTDTSSACSVFSKPHWSGIPISHSPQVSLFPETQQYWN